MRTLLTLGGLMMLCASALDAVGTVVASARHASLSEPAGLLACGTGFVLLARPVRRKKP
jgi:hypothetical protein